MFPASPRPRRLTRSSKHDFVLTPGRYVGTEEAEADGEPIDEKIERLTKSCTPSSTVGASLRMRSGTPARARVMRMNRWSADFVTLDEARRIKGSIGRTSRDLHSLALGSIVPGGGFRGDDLKYYGGPVPAELLLVPGARRLRKGSSTKDGT